MGFWWWIMDVSNTGLWLPNYINFLQKKHTRHLFILGMVHWCVDSIPNQTFVENLCTFLVCWPHCCTKIGGETWLCWLSLYQSCKGKEKTPTIHQPTTQSYPIHPLLPVSPGLHRMHMSNLMHACWLLDILLLYAYKSCMFLLRAFTLALFKSF